MPRHRRAYAPFGERSGPSRNTVSPERVEDSGLLQHPLKADSVVCDNVGVDGFSSGDVAANPEVVVAESLEAVEALVTVGVGLVVDGAG